MNQIILFLFCRPTGPIFFAVLPVDQKINLISPNKEFIFNPDRYLTEDTSNTVNFKNVSSYLSNEILKLACHFQYIQWYNFNSTNVKSNLVTNKCNFTTLTFVYDLAAPICSKIFIFNKFVADCDVDQFLADPTMLCNCDQSPFVDKYHGHILKRDLTIIKNNKFGKIICSNPK